MKKWVCDGVRTVEMSSVVKTRHLSAPAHIS